MFPEDLRLNLVRGLVQTGTPAKDTSQGVTATKPSYRNTHHSLVSIPFPLMWRFHQVLLVFGIVFTHNFFVSALLALSSNGFTWMGGSKVVLTMAAWEQVFLVTLLLILHVLLILLRRMRCEQIKGSQKYFFVILVLSGTNYLITQFGLFELILFHTLSEQLSLERDVSDIMCVNATLNDYWHFPCTNKNSHSEIWVMGRAWMLKVKSLPKPAGYWMRFINKNCSWNQLASVGKDIHQGVC